ncbi:MAG: hypothetical protein ABI904_20710 [Chloroflexota bacterium]
MTNFDELCISVVKDLHDVIQKHFRKDLPIIFFDREGSSPEAIKMTLKANDSKTLTGFTNYIKEYCGY